jgi:hypothetical protein
LGIIGREEKYVSNTVAKFLRGIFTGSAGVGETQPEIEGRNLYV